VPGEKREEVTLKSKWKRIDITSVHSVNAARAGEKWIDIKCD
jgi:hypothetical protein